MSKGKRFGLIITSLLFLLSGAAGCGTDDAGIVLDEQGAATDIDAEEAKRESSENREEREASTRSEDDLTGQDTQGDLETLGTEAGAKPESDLSEVLTEERDEFYDCTPISYDLSALPAMESKLYAEWEGNIYFRQYSDEDIEKGALWASFGYVPATEKEIMYLKPDGTLTQAGTDYGHGTMFIVNGRIYSQRYMKQKYSTGDDFYDSVVYSCKLDGSDVTEYGSSEVLALRGDWIICEARNEGMEGLAVIDVRTGQERVLVDAHEQGLAESQKQFSFLDYLGATEEAIFYYIHPGVHGDFDWGNPGADEDLVLCSVDYEGNIRELTTVTCEEYLEYGSGIGDELGFPMDAALHIHCFKILGNDIYFNVGSDNGSGQMYSGGPIFSMKKDGSKRKVLALSYDTKFYLYDDGINKALFCTTIDNVREVTPVCLEGEAPQDIVLRIANGYSYDEPYVHSSSVYDPLNHSVYPDTSVLLYPDTSGICYVLLTEQDCEGLSVDAYVDGHFSQDIKEVEYLGGKLFFAVTDLTYSAEDSIGWRDGYVRDRTAYYCKDLESGEISLLYEY